MSSREKSRNQFEPKFIEIVDHGAKDCGDMNRLVMIGSRRD